MHSDLKLEVVTTAELDCPSCGAPMEIIDRFTLYGVPAAVEHVKVRCIVGHWFTTPTEWLARADRDPRAAYQEVAANARRLPGTPLSREQMGTSGERSARPLTNGSAHSAAIALGD